MTEARLIAVLGYSEGSTQELHPVCATRLALAKEQAEPGDVVLLSGRARRRRPVSEAELMARAWDVPATRVLLDRSASTTLGNVLGCAAAARALGTRDVLLVTSGWHALRAATLLRAALSGRGTSVTVVATHEHGTLGARLRERACWVLVPFQAALARCW